MSILTDLCILKPTKIPPKFLFLTSAHDKLNVDTDESMRLKQSSSKSIRIQLNLNETNKGGLSCSIDAKHYWHMSRITWATKLGQLWGRHSHNRQYHIADG